MKREVRLSAGELIVVLGLVTVPKTNPGGLLKLTVVHESIYRVGLYAGSIKESIIQEAITAVTLKLEHCLNLFYISRKFSLLQV